MCSSKWRVLSIVKKHLSKNEFLSLKQSWQTFDGFFKTRDDDDIKIFVRRVSRSLLHLINLSQVKGLNSSTSVCWSFNKFHNKKDFRVPLKLIRGFVCAFHPAAPGSTPKHTIYDFIIYSQICALFVLAM